MVAPNACNRKCKHGSCSMSDTDVPKADTTAADIDEDDEGSDIIRIQPPPAPPPARPTTMTTAQLRDALHHNGLDATKLNLAERTWSVDEAHAELVRLGVRGDHFVPRDSIEQRWYGNQGGR